MARSPFDVTGTLYLVYVEPVELVTPTRLVLGGRTFTAANPAVMGIVNATPDSFYAGARYASAQAAVDAVDRMVADGVDIIDVGGVRAGQLGAPVEADEEITRVHPLLEAIRASHPDLLLSLDTWRAEVARACAEIRLDLVNDTWRGRGPGRRIRRLAHRGSGAAYRSGRRPLRSARP